MATAPDLKEDFERLIDKDRLAHGYIFFGEDIEGQFQFTQTLANYLENQSWEVSGKLFIDALFIDAALDGGIETSRSITSFLWQKPVLAPKKTLIVKAAHELTVPAQNAILKIAEEPPEHALMILILRDPEALIAPLASRFQKIYWSERQEIKTDPEIKKLVAQVLRAPTPRERTEIIKLILEEEANLKDFITALIYELRKDRIKNNSVIKSVLRRWTLINQYNTNKKLQLEAAFMPLEWKQY